MDSSEFHDFLVSRCSVRDYSARALTEDQISYILDCARSAPSAGNLESWDAVLVKDADVREEIHLTSYQQNHVRDAPLLIIVCANYIRSMSRYGERGILYAVQDATIACTYMMLAAHALRLHSCWVGAFDEEGVRQALGLPGHVRPLVILCVGHGHPPGSYTDRMPVEEHIHITSW